MTQPPPPPPPLLDKASLPKVPPTPSLRSPKLGPPPPSLGRQWAAAALVCSGTTDPLLPSKTRFPRLLRLATRSIPSSTDEQVRTPGSTNRHTPYLLHGGPARPGPLTPTSPPSQSGTQVPAVGAKGAGKKIFFAAGRDKNGILTPCVYTQNSKNFMENSIMDENLENKILTLPLPKPQSSMSGVKESFFSNFFHPNIHTSKRSARRGSHFKPYMLVSGSPPLWTALRPAPTQPPLPENGRKVGGSRRMDHPRRAPPPPPLGLSQR